MINLENVQKKYADFSLNCTLQVKPGCITGLVGANGAGKSTTFKAILGLIRIDGGKITIMGKEVHEIRERDREEIGVVLGNSGFSGYFTIKQIVPIMAAMYRNFDRDTFLCQCERLKLPLNKKLKEFSTGMRGRLNLLAAMSHAARLLILDEPTAGLDIIAREELLDMLRSYMEDDSRSILISSHISGDLEGFCDEIYMIHQGMIVLHEDTDALTDEYGLLKMSEEEYRRLDRSHLIYCRQESYGYRCLTDHKQYYLDNYPGIVMEKSGIDDMITLIEQGKKIIN